VMLCNTIGVCGWPAGRPAYRGCKPNAVWQCCTSETVCMCCCTGIRV